MDPYPTRPDTGGRVLDVRVEDRLIDARYLARLFAFVLDTREEDGARYVVSLSLDGSLRGVS